MHNGAKITESCHNSHNEGRVINVRLTTAESAQLKELATGHGKRLPLAAGIGIHVNTLRRILEGLKYTESTAKLIRRYLTTLQNDTGADSKGAE